MKVPDTSNKDDVKELHEAIERSIKLKFKETEGDKVIQLEPVGGDWKLIEAVEEPGSFVIIHFFWVLFWSKIICCVSCVCTPFNTMMLFESLTFSRFVA